MKAKRSVDRESKIVLCTQKLQQKFNKVSCTPLKLHNRLSLLNTSIILPGILQTVAG